MDPVKRTCTEVSEIGTDGRKRVRNQPISTYRHLSAYVLLGDPGAGKTTEFEREARQPDTLFVTARDLITYQDRSEWCQKTLFIDGLDEIRAGSPDARTPFDTIRACLEKLGRPRFRLSCREADWFGATDPERLKSVSQDGQVTILHLNPLTEKDIVDILNDNPQVIDSKKFLKKAEQRGLNELLTNPQIIGMFATAVDGGNWPETRKQTFELACRTIIREHNQEHLDASRALPANEDQLLNAAGFLCAVQLIAGNAGYALKPDMANNDFPYLDEPAHNNKEQLHAVARTKLFKSPIQGRITPVHRLVAEYLGAARIAECIERDGLPIGRVLALVTGEDGIVVAELRVLSAWLAALCKSQRRAIIERDPLGVVLYGDVQDFSTQEKCLVLEGLRREAERSSWFRLSHWTRSPFGVLATPDMAAEFHEILISSDRGEAHQVFVDCVLEAMAHGARLCRLDETLLDIVRDASWWPGIRRQALEVIQCGSDGEFGDNIRLKMLLNDINNNTVADAGDDFMGYLLTALYPRRVSAEEVLDYLHAPKQPDHIGSYFLFWDNALNDQSSDVDVSVLLDELTERMETLQPILDDYHFRDLTAGLLARGLEIHGESIDSVRLFAWLGVGLDKHGWSRSVAKVHSDRIRSWLEVHPEIQKGVFEIALDRCAEKENFEYCMHTVRERLLHAEPPADFGWWSLGRMHTTVNEKIARYLLQEAVATLWHERGNAKLSLETIVGIVDQGPKHKAWLNEMLVCRVNPEERKHVAKRSLWKAEQQKKKKQWLRSMKSHQNELREGRVHPEILYDLANAYFSDLMGNAHMERFRNFLNHDEELVQAAFEGLRRSLDRDDVPMVPDIISLCVKGRVYVLARPFLAGLEEFTQGASNRVTDLNDNQIRQAIAFYLTCGTGEDPGWYKSLLDNRPEIVAEVLIAYVTAALRGNKRDITGLYGLAFLEPYRRVARLASLPMLKTFPVRGANHQLTALDELLKAALRYADRPSLLALIKQKLKLRSMNVAQRVRWLAGGLIASPGKYQEPLANFTRGQEKRVLHLTRFLADRHERWSSLDDLPLSVLGLLVSLIGGFFAPYSLDKIGSVSPAMNAASFVKRLIIRLGSLPGKEATDMLNVLLANTELHHWRTTLHGAQFEQRAVQREASFRHPDIRQVSETLNNRSPANASDLAALSTEVLKELAHRIRNGNTDDYRQFWNEGPYRQLTKPKHEEACRDALLSDLQQHLAPLSIDAEPEGHYADDKRADIRVAFGGADGIAIPIEIKKNSDRNLWRAIRDQLIAKYTRDPRAHGFGIYLVFWFGFRETQLPPSGQRPRTTDELERRLRATLSIDENRKISVCVIDVADSGKARPMV